MQTGPIIVLLVLAVGSWIAWRAYARPLSVGLGAVSLLPAITLAKQITWPVVVVAAVLVGVLAWHRWSRTSATVTRWGDRIRRKSGVASTWDVFRRGGAWPVRAKATTVRPSWAGTSWLNRRRSMRTAEVGLQLSRVGFQRVWSSIEDVTLVFGGPRTGKSGWLAGRIIDAPGAALVTSTRTDLHGLTSELRSAKGPVFVFNAVGLAELESTITFDPLTGCADPVSAAERATDMIGATSHAGGHGGSGDRAYWDTQARRVLAALLHAAALGGLSMRDVLDWVSDPENAGTNLTTILRRSPEAGYTDEIRQFIDTNDRTRTSITSTIMPALGWLTSPAASAAASGGQAFDVETLIRERATVYLLGAEETHAAPLVCALTGHIAREARRIAARQPGGRLDPPLGLFLDEAALISPVPLDSWTADMGGRGVMIVAAFQSRAQLIDRYGDAKAAVVLNNAANKMLFGGTGDRDDLTFWSTLGGDREETTRTTDLHGRVASRTNRKVPVLSPAQLANLPAGKVVTFRRGMPLAIGRAQMAWRRPDVRAQLAPDAASVRARAFARRCRVAAGAARVRSALVRCWARFVELLRAVLPSREKAVAEPPKSAEIVPFPVPPTPAQRVRPTPYPRSARLHTVEWADSAREAVDEPGSWN